MNVIDFLKEKSDRLARNRVELLEMFNPQVKDYFNEAMNNARNLQWLSWALDQKKIASGSDATEDSDAWPLVNHSAARHTLQNITEKLNEVTFVGQWLKIEQDRIDRFADVTDDAQWIHTDPERSANESPFKTTIAHGFLTLSLIPKLTGAVNAETPPYPGAKMVINMGMNKVRYPYPVKVGSNIRATKKVIDVTPVRRGLEVTEEITIEIEGCRRPACIAQTLVMLVF
jgi:acyl dehydratase